MLLVAYRSSKPSGRVQAPHDARNEYKPGHGVVVRTVPLGGSGPGSIPGGPTLLMFESEQIGIDMI